MFFIQHKFEPSLWWNNDSGWGSCSTATGFSLRETDTLDLPHNGVWVSPEGLREEIDRLNEVLEDVEQRLEDVSNYW